MAAQRRNTMPVTTTTTTPPTPTTITITPETTVGDLAAEVPASIRIFESWKIDYCCGGRTSLADACAHAGRSVGEFLTDLEHAAAVPDATAHDWSAETLTG